MSITPLPSLDRTSATFRDDVDAYFLTDLPAFSVEVEAARLQIVAAESTSSAAAGTAASAAGTATTQAGTATTKAGEATDARDAAVTAKAAAEAALDAFDDRYLGSKAADPSVDNDGNALLTGALYWNTASSVMKVYTGSAWTAAYLPASGYATLVGVETLTNKTLSVPTIEGYTEGVSAPSAGSSFTISLAADTVHGITTNANTTITLPAPSAGKSFQLQIAYGGAHSITLSVTGGSSIGWASGVAFTPTSANGKTDVLNFTCNAAGTKWLAAVFGQNF